MDLVAGDPPFGGWRVQRVGADTLHRVAAALLVMSAFGRRATVADIAVLGSTFLTNQLELFSPTVPVRGCRRGLGVETVAAAVADALDALPSPGQVHLATNVVVKVGIAVGTTLTLVGGRGGGFDVPPGAWLGLAKL